MERLARWTKDISASATLDITSKAKKMAKEGIDVVNLAAGEPDFDTPEHIKLAAIKAVKDGFTKYTPSSGLLDLRKAISRKFKAENSIDYAADQIVVSNGAKHSLYNIFQVLLNEGDEVIIPSPYWLSYPEMVKAAGGRAVYLDTRKENNFRVTEPDLAKNITKRTKAFILNSPANPTGSVYNAEEMRFISKLAVGNKFFVVSDEIYEKLIFDDKRHISIASLGKDIYGLTVTVNGLSKSYSMTGWRIGYAAGPADVMKAVSDLQSHATSNASSISQKAAMAALTESQECVLKMREEFEARRNLMVSRINGMRRISCTKPDGAFYVFCDISGLGIGSVEASKRLLDEARIAVIPGAPFGADSFIRLSFATSQANIAKGLDRLAEWLSKQR